MIAEETIGMPVAVNFTGRCRCGARVVYLRGQHRIHSYNLLSTNGMASGIHLKLASGKPERHAYPTHATASRLSGEAQ